MPPNFSFYQRSLNLLYLHRCCYLELGTYDFFIINFIHVSILYLIYFPFLYLQNCSEPLIFASKIGAKDHNMVLLAMRSSENRGLEGEALGKIYPPENKFALELERILHKKVNLIVLNRAKALLADEIIRKGEPILINNNGLFFAFLCLIIDKDEI